MDGKDRVDYALLRRLADELTAQARQAAYRDNARHLRQAVRSIMHVVDPESLEEWPQINWPRLELLEEMFLTGRDGWIADLLGCSRETVQSRRKVLEIAPFKRGGDQVGLQLEKERWLTEWRARLEAEGWQPPKKKKAG